MASLRKHPHSPYWIACFTDSNGKRTTRSTKSKNRNLAMKMAVEWEVAAGQAMRGTLTESRARTVINSILEHAGQEPVVFYRTRDWLSEWLRDKGKSSQKTTIQKYDQVIKRFLTHLGPKADSGLASLTPEDIRSFRDLLEGEGRAAATVNQIIAKILTAPLAKAVRLGYTPLNPCKAVEPLKAKKTEAGTFTIEQIQALLDAAPTSEWSGLILAGFYTGQRLSDLAHLNWEQVNLTEKRMYFEQRKGGSKVAVPIHDDLLNHLLSMPSSENPNGRVFLTLSEITGSGKSGLSEGFKRIMVKAGIPLTKRLQSAGGVGRGRNLLSFHSLRHSFNSAMANAGISQEIRQKLTGHRDADTNKLYTHLEFPALEAAIQAVPSVSKRPQRQ